MKTSRVLSRFSQIEWLGARIAPVAVFTYADVDGDLVTVKTSKGTNGDLKSIIMPYLRVPVPVPGVGFQLQKIDFSALPAVFAGTDLTVTAKRTSVGGDGLVNVGDIDATGKDGGTSLDLGSISVSGDLGAIAAGDNGAATAAVRSLTVGSMGRYGTDTQSVASATLTSSFTGALGKLTVRGDMVGVIIEVDGGAVAAAGKLGPLTIGGSLLEGNFGGTGSISTSGDLGPVKIGADLVGNGVTDSGRIQAGDKLIGLTVGGSIIGHAIGSGYVSSSGDLGPVKVGGSLVGGVGAQSGTIHAGAELTSVVVDGSVLGGPGDSSSMINSIGTAGPITIRGDVVGGPLPEPRRSTLSTMGTM